MSVVPTNPRILLAEPFDLTAVAFLRQLGDVTVLDRHDETALLDSVAGFDALLVRSAARVTPAVIERADRLKVIGRGGVGLETIDVDAARSRGIQVVYTPYAATDAVADLAIAMMIALSRNLTRSDSLVRSGNFLEARGDVCTHEMRELTVGVVGLGLIGRAVARRCHHGFGMRIVYNDILPAGWLDFVATPLSKEELFRKADVITLHVPLTQQTRGMIDAACLKKFKAGAILINTARGAVVDGEAVARALSKGSLGGAGLDVFDPEPLPENHPLLRAPHTILTAHIGARTRRGLGRMNDVVQDVARVLKGEAPHHPAWT